MARVQVTLVAARQPAGHKHAVLRCGDKRVVLPITSTKVDHSGFADDWQQVPRGGDKPLLGSAGGQLHTAKFAVTVARKDGSPVEDILVDLINFSRTDSNVVTMHNYGYLEAGPWRLTDVSITSDQRLLGTNQITRAVLALTVTEAIPEPAPRATRKKKHKSSGSGGGHGRGGKPKTYTVKAGDTLTGIAVKIYGDANRWRDIAKANHIRDPRRLRIGQVLTLP